MQSGVLVGQAEHSRSYETKWRRYAMVEMITMPSAAAPTALSVGIFFALSSALSFGMLVFFLMAGLSSPPHTGPLV